MLVLRFVQPRVPLGELLFPSAAAGFHFESGERCAEFRQVFVRTDWEGKTANFWVFRAATHLFATARFSEWPVVQTLVVAGVILWVVLSAREFYLQLTEVEDAFKELKGDLALRPIFHQLEQRIESHIFISFLTYCLQVTLKARLKQCAKGLTPRAVLEKFAAVQMLDVHLPTTDGREIVMNRYTHPEKDLQLLLHQLKLTLPEQGPPKITAAPQI